MNSPAHGTEESEVGRTETSEPENPKSQNGRNPEHSGTSSSVLRALVEAGLFKTRRIVPAIADADLTAAHIVRIAQAKTTTAAARAANKHQSYLNATMGSTLAARRAGR